MSNSRHRERQRSDPDLTGPKVWIASSLSLLAMTNSYLLAARIRPSDHNALSLQHQRAQGMPGARFAPAASRAKNKKHGELVTTVTPVSPGIPRAAGFNG